MVSLREGLLEGLRGAYCAQVNNQPEWWINLRRILTPGVLRDAGDMLNRAVCGRPSTEDDFPPPPFTGGQCSGVSYRVEVTVTFVDYYWSPGGRYDGVWRCFAVVPGPVRGIKEFVRIDGLKTQGVEGGSGMVTLSPNLGSNSHGAVLYSDIEITREDGQPDECGDPLFDPGPFEPTPINIDIDVTHGPNNEYNLTIPVVIAPVYVAFDGTLNAPVTFNISPDISLEGTWTLFPDGNLTIKFPTRGDDGPGDRGDDEPAPGTEHDDPTEDDPDTPGQPDDPDEPPNRIHFLLCRAAIQDNSPTGSIFQEVGPDIFIPRLGSARFGATIDGVTFWTEDIDIKGLNSIIECPIPFGATRFTVNAARGVVINYSAVSTDPGPWPNYLELGPQFTSDRR